jgi:hypothetical protein
MVTKGYQKGVYERVTKGDKEQTPHHASSASRFSSPTAED